MSARRIYAIFIRQLFLMKNSPARLVPVFLWIVVDIIQWGFISKYLGAFGRDTFSFISVILGAIVLWGFMSRIQQGVFTAFMEDVWIKNFINYFASPLQIREYVAGLVLTSITTGIAGFIAMIIIASLAFGYNVFKIGILILPFLLILFVFGIALGIFVAALIFRLGPSAEWLAWPIPVVLSIISGVYYPVSTLPTVLALLAKINPAAYVFESLRTILGSASFSPALAGNLILGAILALAYLLLMYYFFIRIYRGNLKTGQISRFDSEGP